MKVQLKDLSQQSTWEEVQRFSNQNFDSLASALTQQLSFGDNIDCQIVTAVFTSTVADLTIPHTLKRVPTGYIVCNKAASSDVYNGVTPWTKTNIYLRASVATTVKLVVF